MVYFSKLVGQLTSPKRIKGGSKLAIKELLSVKDISEMTSLSEAAVRKLISSQVLKSVRINTSIRVLRNDFDAFVKTLKESQ